MKRIRDYVPSGAAALTLAAVFFATVSLAAAGCGKGDEIGETVPGPPPDLVKKSFKPPVGQAPAPATAGRR